MEFYKLKKIVGNQQIVKYYGENQSLAATRKTKNWDLKKDSRNPGNMLSQSLNNGELGTPRYKIILDDKIEIDCPVEGLANQLVEKLGSIYKNVRAEKIETEQVSGEVEFDEDGL